MSRFSSGSEELSFVAAMAVDWLPVSWLTALIGRCQNHVIQFKSGRSWLAQIFDPRVYSPNPHVSIIRPSGMVLRKLYALSLCNASEVVSCSVHRKPTAVAHCGDLSLIFIIFQAPQSFYLLVYALHLVRRGISFVLLLLMLASFVSKFPQHLCRYTLQATSDRRSNTE